MLQDADVILMVAPFIHLGEKRALNAASQALRPLVQMTLSRKRTLWYVCGGYNRHDASGGSHGMCLDPRAAAWEPVLSMPGGRAWAAGAVLGHHLYICGGFRDMGSHLQDALTLVERFDLRTKCWEAVPPMAERRVAAVACSLGGRLYVCGGMNPTTCSVEAFDPAVGAWQAAPAMAQRRAWAAAGVLAGRLYMCGGFDDQRGCRENLSTAECFDPGAGRWAAAPSMGVRRLRAAAAVLQGKLYVCGGESTFGYESTVEALSPGAKAWEPMPLMLRKRFGAAAAAMAGRLYIGGGFAATGDRSSQDASGPMECFDPETGEWEVIQAPWVGRQGEAAVAVRLP